MALNSLGQISMGGSTAGESIALELGLGATTAISLGTPAVYKLAGKSSASNVDMGSFRGKRNSVNEVILSSNRVNLNIYNEAVAVGWDKSSPFVYTISAGTIIYSNDTTAACTTGGAFPGGLTIYNGGTIVGRGGTGGSGGQVLANGGAGLSGSTAITITANCTIVNNGIIGGGGGGGGGGNGGSSTYAAGGGGGGGAGYGSGGSSNSGGTQNLGSAGNPGGTTIGGTGGTSLYSAGTGGTGGSLGVSGTTAGSAWVSYFTLRVYVNGGAGGGAGIAISKNGYTVTTSGAGTTYGAVG